MERSLMEFLKEVWPAFVMGGVGIALLYLGHRLRKQEDQS